MRVRADSMLRVATSLSTSLLVLACAQSGVSSPSADVPSSPVATGASLNPSSANSVESPLTTASAADARVVLQLDADQYSPGDPIVVRVRNGLDEAITTVDQQAFCGVLRLDREVSAGWEDVQSCISGPPPRAVTIEPGQERVETWAEGLGKGVYRARLVYAIGETFTPGAALEVTSRLEVG
jgi:hypothetical protein